MITAYFSLAEEQYTLQERLLDVLNDIECISRTSNNVEVSIMIFSFTDQHIFNRIVEVLENSPNLKMRILADYSNISNDKERKIPLLIAKKIPNLSIRFKADFPYEWDKTNLKFKWSYAASMGFLHHKTLCVSVMDNPILLVTGSYNWTKNSNQSYENLLIFDKAEENISLISSFMNEFEGIWNSNELSLSLKQVNEQTKFIIESRLEGIDITPNSFLFSENSIKMNQAPHRKKVLVGNHIIVAFNAKNPISEKVTNGAAESNQNRCFDMMKPKRNEKRVPVTITNVSLDLIFRSPSGSELNVAMFALSNRVAVFGALIDAARRGVKLKIILDKKVNFKTAQLFKEKAILENLPIKVKLSNRMMHNKYLVNRDINSVLTGTANFTTDAIERHSEHMISFTEQAGITRKFDDNFNLIWSRLR